jgi:class 3 adenylate cyclase
VASPRHHRRRPSTSTTCSRNSLPTTLHGRLAAVFGGAEVDTAGDGLLATFDGHARAIRCARVIQREAAPLGLRLHAGVHTGEVEMFAVSGES